MGPGSATLCLLQCHRPCRVAPLPPRAGGDGGAIGVVSNAIMRFQGCAFYDNYCQWGSGGAGEAPRACTHADAWRVRVGSMRAGGGHTCTPPQPSPTLSVDHPNRAVSTSAEAWFVDCQFERNIVGNNGGAVLLEGGCPAGYFVRTWFKVGRQASAQLKLSRRRLGTAGCAAAALQDTCADAAACARLPACLPPLCPTGRACLPAAALRRRTGQTGRARMCTSETTTPPRPSSMCFQVR